MKQFVARLSNGMCLVVVADSYAQASLCVANMLSKTDEYRDRNIAAGQDYRVYGLEGRYDFIMNPPWDRSV
jgi:hypothetical protein